MATTFLTCPRGSHLRPCCLTFCTLNHCEVRWKLRDQKFQKGTLWVIKGKEISDPNTSTGPVVFNSQVYSTVSFSLNWSGRVYGSFPHLISSPHFLRWERKCFGKQVRDYSWYTNYRRTGFNYENQIVSFSRVRKLLIRSINSPPLCAICADAII